MHQLPHYPSECSSDVEDRYKNSARYRYSRAYDGEEELETVDGENQLLRRQDGGGDYLIRYIHCEVGKNASVRRRPVLDDVLLGHRQVVAGPCEIAEEIRDLIVRVKRSSHELPRAQRKSRGSNEQCH